MAYYAKTERKFQQAKESGNRDRINEIFERFVKEHGEENRSFLLQRALQTFGSQVSPEMVDDQLQDIYLSMLLFPEEQLLEMDSIQLLKIFRSICNSPATVGGFFQKLKYANHLDIDDLEI